MALEQLTKDEQKYFDSKGTEAPAAASLDSRPSVALKAPDAAPSADGQKASDPAPSDPRMVPLAALHEERERRKELQRKVEDVSRRAEQRFGLIAQKLAEAPQADQPKRDVSDPRPDPETDTVGALKMTAEEVKTLADFKRQLEAREATARNVQAVLGQAARLEQEFMREAPDYPAANMFLRQARARELAALGLDPLRTQQTLAAELVQVAHLAMQQGRNPGDLLYSLAVMRGYRKPDAPAREADSEAGRLARIAKGQEAGTSLGAAAGSAPAKTGIEALLGMTDGEFSAALEKMSADELRRNFGN